MKLQRLLKLGSLGSLSSNVHEGAWLLQRDF